MRLLDIATTLKILNMLFNTLIHWMKKAVLTDL